MPLVFDPRAASAMGHPKYLLVLAGALGCAALLAGGAAAGERWWRGNPLRWPVLALVAWTAVSATASDHRHVALFGFPGSDDGLWTTVALAIVFLATAAAFRGHVRDAMKALWFGAGVGVLAFGLGQLQDRLFFPGGWDWARPSISPGTIGSTLGNPNHLASFLAILLPLGVALAITSHGRLRAAVMGAGVVLVVELAITASRGAWVAAAAALAVLALLLRLHLGRFGAPAGRALGAALALTLVVTVALGAAGVAKRDLGGTFAAGAGSTVDLRLEVWGTALRMAADHPLAGVGPDAFAVVFPQYESERFSWRFGPFTVANGAHNLFLNTLADLGAVGLLALLSVLAGAAVVIARGWRRLPAGSERRVQLAAVTAGLVAYVVQASFNIQETSLSLCFWVLLGLAVVLTEPNEAADGSEPMEAVNAR